MGSDLIEKFKFVKKPLLTVGDNNFSLLSLFFALGIAFCFIKIAKIIEKWTYRFCRDRELDSGVSGSISAAARYLILVVGFFVTFETLGISFSSLAALSAVLMVGIGFGLQNIAQNFISGLIILFERPIKLGDMVTVKGISGKVQKIGARSTVIRTRDDVTIIVPNSQFISEQVINDSFSGEKIRLRLDVSVAYGSDTEKVRKTLLEVAGAHPKILKNPFPKVFFESFGDSSLDFALMIWSSDLWNTFETLSDLRFEVDRIFRDRNITIPFPQRDLHLFNHDRLEREH